MSWVGWLKIILQLAAFFARKADRLETERNLTNELLILQGKRIEAAGAARDDVLAGRVPPSPDDPYRRD